MRLSGNHEARAPTSNEKGSPLRRCTLGNHVAPRKVPSVGSEVVSTEYGFHLFKLVEKKPARKRELAEVRATIEQKLLTDLRSERQTAYVKGLRDKAQVKVNEQALLSVTGRPLGGATVEP